MINSALEAPTNKAGAEPRLTPCSHVKDPACSASPHVVICCVTLVDVVCNEHDIYVVAAELRWLAAGPERSSRPSEESDSLCGA